MSIPSSDTVNSVLQTSLDVPQTDESLLTPISQPGTGNSEGTTQATYALTIFSANYDAEKAIIETLMSVPGVAVSNDPIDLLTIPEDYRIMTQDDLIYHIANDGRKVEPHTADQVAYYVEELGDDSFQTYFIQHPYLNRPLYLYDAEMGVRPADISLWDKVDFGEIECDDSGDEITYCVTSYEILEEVPDEELGDDDITSV
jgi:hypothetical protein